MLTNRQKCLSAKNTKKQVKIPRGKICPLAKIPKLSNKCLKAKTAKNKKAKIP
jgi:hypothetical protein